MTHMVLVPGFWVGAASMAPLQSVLSAQQHPCTIAPLLSTGHATSPATPTMADDAAGVRAVVAPLVEAGERVVMVLHCADGFVGSMAIAGLSRTERAARGESGGVCRLMFVAGAAWDEGFRHGPLPFSSFEGDRMYCASPETLLYNDFTPEQAAPWLEKLQCQPSEGWDGVVSYGGGKDVPSTYLMCEGDAVLPPAMQRDMAARAGSTVETCKAGHMAILSDLEAVADVVKRAVEVAEKEG